MVSNTATDHPTPTVPVLDLLDTATFDLNKLLSHLPKELKEDVKEIHTCTQCNFNSEKQANLVIHIAYVHDQTFFVCDVCETRTKTNDALNFHKRRKHPETKEEGLTDGQSQVLLVESDQKEMGEKLNAETERIEVLKTKLFLSKNIEGLENSFIPGEELSTKVVFMMEHDEPKDKIEEKKDISEDEDKSEEKSSEESSETGSEPEVGPMKNTFKWKCQASDIDREFLENELPCGFEYIINRFKMIVKSDIPHESKYETRFLVGVCSEDDATSFVNVMESKTGTNFNAFQGSRVGKKNWKQTQLKCARNVRTQTSPELAKAKGKGAGQGREKGIERQKGKDTNCKTTMSTTLKPCEAIHDSGNGPICFKLAVSLNYDHTHAVESTNSWNFLEVEETARLRLLQLFDEGLTPSKAKRVLEDELRAKYGEDWLEMSSKRSINPDTNFVFNLHTQYWKDKFGTINGPDSFQKAKDFISNYNMKAGTEIASIRQLTCGTVVVVVVDELSKRVHTTVPQSGQIVFIDGTGSLDRMNHQLVKLMTESPVGGLPLGFMILSDQTEKTLDAGFEDLKKLLPEKAFYGRGAERGPELIMTDDDPVRNFIKVPNNILTISITGSHELPAQGMA